MSLIPLMSRSGDPRNNDTKIGFFVRLNKMFQGHLLLLCLGYIQDWFKKTMNRVLETPLPLLRV